MRPGHLLGILTILTACDIPTSAPIIEQRWVIPADTLIIEVSQFLPAGVTESDDVFVVDVPPFASGETLGDLCPACTLLDGTTAPSPGFSGSFGDSQSLPPEVVQATLASGSLDVVIVNGIGFDPIHVGDATGTVTFSLTGRSGMPLGSVTMDGARGDSIPVGVPIAISMPLAPGAVVSSPLTVRATVVSPAGGPVPIDVASTISITATPTVRVSSARVAMSAKTVNFGPMDLGVGGLDAGLIDRVQAGSFRLDVTNTFGVGLDAQATIRGPTFTDISKRVSVDAGATSATSVEFTGAELRTFLGSSGATFSGSGATAPGAVATVSPGDRVTIRARIDLTIHIG
ncbi:MAG: hypothetical protein OEZ65_00925 [Gemmatimonadota bacterium]|nr:hypothetical protein [Gemmatimonadota bacterium]MDH5758118.1 hypothetical protein [Gemmatimonadota bacterium]